MHKKTILKACLLAATVMIANSAGAGIIYSVSSTPVINCGNNPHGLWTNRYTNAGCQEYYNFQPGSTLEVEGLSAVLSATALNEAGNLATINIIFGGFEETYPYYKNGGTPDYNGTDNPVNWDFYTFISSGSISFSNGDNFSPLLVGQPAGGIASTGKPVLQIGDGANDKSSGFGASAWLDVYPDGAQNLAATAHTNGSHWDLNMSLAFVPEDSEEVPAPGTLALLGLGLASLYASGRSRTKGR